METINEIWKPIPKYEGLYEISNFGKIKCLEHKCPGRYPGKFRTVKEHIMSTVLNKTNGYYYVTLSNKDRGKTYLVHKLVASIFVSNPNNYVIVNHKDENKQNNAASNLEWCTSYYNNTYNNIHLKRKHYVHKHEYLQADLIKSINNVLKKINNFKTLYSKINIDKIIQELLSQKNYGSKKQ